MQSYLNQIIHPQTSIKEALTLLDQQASIANVLFVLDAHKKLIGTITDGDIRRGLLKDAQIQDNVEKVMHRKFRFLTPETLDKNHLQELKNAKISWVPILNSEGNIIEIINLNTYKIAIPVQAVLMAGGKGERLMPLTQNTPKPLLMVGDKPIIAHNIHRLVQHGINHIHISINYLGEQIKTYFGDGSQIAAELKYVEEAKPLGTAGALSLVDDFKNEPILVMNSDLLTTIDFEDFYQFFESQDADIAIASTSYHVDIPYAVMETDADGQVSSLREKPRYTYYSNAGIYLLKKEALAHIPKAEFYNLTDLIECLIAKGKKVVSYPILGYWLDIGKHEDYRKAQEDIKHLKL